MPELNKKLYLFYIILMFLLIAGCANTKKVVTLPSELTIDQIATVQVNRLSMNDINRFLNYTRNNPRYAEKRKVMLKNMLVGNKEIPQPHLVDAIKLFNKESSTRYFVLAFCQYAQVFIYNDNGERNKMREVDCDFTKAVYSWSLANLGQDPKKAAGCAEKLLKIIDPNFLNS